MSARQKQVVLAGIVIFTGPEQDARKVAFDVTMQIRVKHTMRMPARQAFVTAAALAILRGGIDEFVPESPKSPWTVRIFDAVAASVSAKAPEGVAA